MPRDQFNHVKHWVFDLDNTLYPPAVRLFDQIEKRMTTYVMDALGVSREQANHLRVKYWRQYGTTLAGLMREHDVDPGPYLTDVHEIDFSVLDPDPHLADLIAELPGRKIVYTNGTAPYAAQVLNARGLEAAFDAIYGVEHANFLPKPERAAFEAVFERDGIAPNAAAMFEDDIRNLAAPYEMGVRTVHVTDAPEEANHVHHQTDDLNRFLARLT